MVKPTGVTVPSISGVVCPNGRNIVFNFKSDMDTLPWEIFVGKIDAVSQAIGEAFLPVARKLLDWANELADEWGPLVIAWAENFGAALDTLWENMAAGETISFGLKNFMSMRSVTTRLRKRSTA